MIGKNFILKNAENFS